MSDRVHDAEHVLGTAASPYWPAEVALAGLAMDRDQQRNRIERGTVPLICTPRLAISSMRWLGPAADGREEEPTVTHREA
jgi:hypothetical protein